MAPRRAYVEGATPLWLRLAPAIFLLFWSAGFAFAKMGLVYAGPLTFLSLRYILVMVVLVPLFLVLRPPLPKTGVDWCRLIVVGFFIQGVYFCLSYASMETSISAGLVALIVSLQPVVVGVFAPYLTGERVNVRRWAGLVLGLLGAAVVILSRSSIQVVSLPGVMYAFGALMAISIGTLCEKRFGIPQHPVTANLVQYAVGLALILPLAWGFEGVRLTWSGPLLISLAYLVVCNSLISITLLLAMIRRGEVSRVSALFFLVPPAAALIAWGLIGEAMPVLAWVGMVLAAAGVAVVSRPAARARRFRAQ